MNWYNSYPNTKSVDLSNYVKSLSVVGNGNVAIDIARILLKDSEKLRKTDINLSALKEIENSKIRNVSVIGRRGAVQSSFTLK